MEKKLKFECSKCGCEILELVSTNAVVSSSIDSIFVCEDGYPAVSYNEDVVEDSCPDRFQCQSCGKVLFNYDGTTISDEDELAYWLLAQDYNK